MLYIPAFSLVDDDVEDRASIEIFSALLLDFEYLLLSLSCWILNNSLQESDTSSQLLRKHIKVAARAGIHRSVTVAVLHNTRKKDVRLRGRGGAACA